MPVELVNVLTFSDMLFDNDLVIVVLTVLAMLAMLVMLVMRLAMLIVMVAMLDNVLHLFHDDFLVHVGIFANRSTLLLYRDCCTVSVRHFARVLHLNI
mmetsp:Transcript_21549/g.68751  ORF Transcript_21549/g.68751 Transcript_21549/m.68751 type:complete len:98 (-) Transcript_21549:375-668(-)